MNIKFIPKTKIDTEIIENKKSNISPKFIPTKKYHFHPFDYISDKVIIFGDPVETIMQRKKE